MLIKCVKRLILERPYSVLKWPTNIFHGLCSPNKILSNPLLTCLQFYTDDPKATDADSELKALIQEMYNDFDVKRNKLSRTTAILKKQNENLYDVTVENEALDSEFSADIIYDYDEERILREKGILFEKKRRKRIALIPTNLERGKMGVFDVEELVELLNEQKARDVVAIKIPKEYQFVEYLIIATGNSKKHINVMTEYINKVYKMKKNEQDRYIRFEGRKSEWVAVDMTTLCLHLMTEEVREEKDLELLWTVGADYDDNCRKQFDEAFSFSTELGSH